MRARLVTGYIPIPGHPRGPEEYGALGEKLGGVPVPKKAFYQPVESTWLWKFVKSLQTVPRVSAGDNPAKNTLAYHCANHQKTEWLLSAVEAYPDDEIFIWCDYGIFHQPGICNEAIVRFMESVDDKAIYAPGCWERPPIIESANPCWRFCGSVLAVPKQFVPLLHFACVSAAMKHVRTTNNVEWETNTWARVERHDRLPLCWYKADHNVSMFTNVPTLKVPT